MGENKGGNGMIRWILAIVFILIFGAYGYTTFTVTRTEDRLLARLDRLEDTIRREFKDVLDRLGK